MKLFACLLVIVILSLVAPPGVMSWAEWLGGRLDALGRRRKLCIAAFGLISLGFSVGANLVFRTPAPRCADEFGYLLEGDTFAHGRLKNPTPVMWRHLETLHEFFTPVYAAKYPPAQGLMLALGQRLWKPIFGVWISTAIASGAILWMLLAWMPARWALPVGLVSCFNPQLLSWNWTYWGGAVALGAGALVLGGYRRIADPSQPGSVARTGAIAGVGMGVLAICRPYEGCVLSALVMSLTFWKLARLGQMRRFWTALGPLLVTLGIGIAFLLYYDKAITGSPFQMPYMVYERAYNVAPIFVWQKMPTITIYRSNAMASFYEGAREYAASQQNLRGFLRASIAKLPEFRDVFWHWLVLAPFLALPVLVRKDRWLAEALVILVIMGATESLSVYVFPHYPAPGMGLVFVLMGACLRGIWQWRAGRRPAGAAFVALFTVFIFLIAVSFFCIRKEKNQAGTNWEFWRNRVIAGLEESGGRHLVLVRYSPWHNWNQEWVYNDADPDAAPVLWARDLGAGMNKEIIDYYKDRAVWFFDPDTDPKPTPAAAAGAAQTGS